MGAFTSGFGLLGDPFNAPEDAKNPAVWGTKPIVPTTESSIKGAAEANLAALPDITDLANKSTDLYADLMERAQPGYKAMLKASGDDISQMLAGKLPGMDDWVKRRAAETSADTGTGGSFALGQELNLGFTARSNLISAGLSAADRWTARAKERTFDFTKMFVSPEDQWKRDNYAATVAAAPDPMARGRFEAKMAALGMILGIYSGGSYGGSGYKSVNSGGGGGSDGYTGNMSGGSDFQSYFGNEQRYDQQPATQGYDSAGGDYSGAA